MSRWLGRLFAATLLAALGGAAGRAHARPCQSSSDRAAVLAATAAIQQQCDCAGAASYKAYVVCAERVAKSLNQAGELPPGCVNELDRCAKRSTCGRSGWVTCCRTNRSGRTHCYVKRDASLCKAPSGGTAVVGQCPSCCQACSAGSCEAPPTVACCVPSSVDGALLEQVDGLVCEELTSAECEQRGGIDEGPGVCQPETCHPPTTTSTTATTTSSTTVTTTTSTSATTETSTTTTTTTSTTGEPVCGNEIVEAGEECDPPVSLTCPNLGSPGGALWQCLPNCACPRD